MPTTPPHQHAIDRPEVEKRELGKEDGHFLTGFKLYVVVVGLMLVSFLVTLNGGFVAPMSVPPHFLASTCSFFSHSIPGSLTSLCACSESISFMQVEWFCRMNLVLLRTGRVHGQMRSLIVRSSLSLCRSSPLVPLSYGGRTRQQFSLRVLCTTLI
jgi:hypothetical protein